MFIFLYSCYLIRGAAKLFKSGLISGQANCSEVFSESENCFDVGVGYNYGDYLDYFTSDDPVACQSRCLNYRGCTHFSYYTSNSECYMKTGNQARRNNADVVSGPRSCGPTTGSTTPTSVDNCTLPGRVCLRGGGEHEGNVFIGLGSGVSKPVCDDSWDTNDGIVVCRELGYAGIVKVRSRHLTPRRVH